MSAFDGQVAIVTGGGSSGDRVPSVGDACARLLAKQGAKVAIVDVNTEAAAATVRLIESEGGTASAITADLTKEEACAEAVAEIMKRWRRIDVLVNNVGVGFGQIVTQTDEARFDEAMNINVKSVLFMCKYTIPHMKTGSIVNLSTTAIDTPSASAVYGASKAAVEGLTKHIALQYGPDGIRCNAVRPGEVWTAMVDRNCKTEADADRLRADRRARTALVTDGDAWDIANAVAFLASSDARWITGQVITVDGGAGVLRANPEWRSHHSYWRAKET